MVFAPVPFTFSVGLATVLLYWNFTCTVRPLLSAVKFSHVTSFAAVPAAVAHSPYGNAPTRLQISPPGSSILPIAYVFAMPSPRSHRTRVRRHETVIVALVPVKVGLLTVPAGVVVPDSCTFVPLKVGFETVPVAVPVTLTSPAVPSKVAV